MSNEQSTANKKVIERPSGTVDLLVGLDEWQAWIDARPAGDQRYLTLAIRAMIDDMPVNQVREITTCSLAVERRKDNERITLDERS